MKIVMTGASGMLGRALLPHLEAAAHEVTRLVRRTPSAHEAFWDPANGVLDPAVFDGTEAVIHLAGESIGEGRWTAAKKSRIHESRIGSSRLLADTIAGLNSPPKVVISSSAIGYYGDRGEEILTERAGAGTGFLAEVCRDWEAALAPAVARGVRVVYSRSGIILATSGGALAKLLFPFRLGVGGKIGSGRQYWSWISLDDYVGAVMFLLSAPEVAGPVNFTSPVPLTNAEFTRVLARVLSRPAVIPIPGFALRIAIGEMTDPLLLASARVVPEALLSAGYRFQFDDLATALRHLLRK